MKKKFFIFISVFIPIIIVYYYYQYYEIEQGFSIQCSFLEITGLQCPGCGGQRAFHFLLHGEFTKALRYNFIIIGILPLLSFVYFSLIQFYLFNQPQYINSNIFNKKYGYYFIIIILLFFILRNIPYKPFMFLTPP